MGLAALLVVRSRPSNVATAVAGAICALLLFTSPYTAIWTAAMLSVVVGARRLRTGGVKAVLMAAVSGLAGAALAAGAVLVLIALLLPDWFASFGGVLLGSSTHKDTGGGYFIALLHGDVRGWIAGFKRVSDPWDIPKLLFAAGILGVAAVAASVKRGRNWDRAWLWIALLAALSLVCEALEPYQGNYPRFTSAMLLAGAASLLPMLDLASRRTCAWAVVGGFVLINLVTLPEWTRVYVLRIGVRDSLARAEGFIAQHRDQFVTGAERMAVSPQTYLLWRQEGVRPLCTEYPGFIDPAAQARLTTVEMAYRGSRDPNQPQVPVWFAPGSFTLYHQPRLPQIPRLFGVALAKSSYTWESAIYRRPAP
jgi:hypothetical protein